MNNFFKSRILPAVTIQDDKQALAIAQAFINGGLNIMEIPFRTNSATSSIENILKEFPKMTVGAGTILTPQQVVLAKKSGAAFGLSPGFNPTVVKEAIKNDLPFIPGVMTPTEIELALQMGCNIQKLFPASQVGGTQMLKALLGPYGHTGVQFIPMGGVDLENMNEFLELKNVIAIGGSWLASKELVQTKKYQIITNNVIEALKRSL